MFDALMRINYDVQVGNHTFKRVALYDETTIKEAEVQKLIQTEHFDPRVILMDEEQFETVFANQKRKLQTYEPCTWGVHTLELTFMYEEAICVIIQKTGGNVKGGSLMEIDDEINALIQHAGNQKYAEFYPEDAGKESGTVKTFIFHEPNGDVTYYDGEDGGITDHLVKIEIIDYEPTNNERDTL